MTSFQNKKHIKMHLGTFQSSKLGSMSAQIGRGGGINFFYSLWCISTINS